MVEAEDTKAIWKSKTMIGILMVWFGFKLKGMGIDIPDEMLESITNVLIEGGTLLAGFGRLVTTQKLR